MYINVDHYKLQWFFPKPGVFGTRNFKICWFGLPMVDLTISNPNQHRMPRPTWPPSRHWPRVPSLTECLRLRTCFTLTLAFSRLSSPFAAAESSRLRGSFRLVEVTKSSVFCFSQKARSSVRCRFCFRKGFESWKSHNYKNSFLFILLTLLVNSLSIMNRIINGCTF